MRTSLVVIGSILTVSAAVAADDVYLITPVVAPSSPTVSAVPPVDLRAAVIESLRDRGFTIASADLAVVNEGSKTTVTLDLGTLLEQCSKDIQSRLGGAPVEIRAVGQAPKNPPKLASTDRGVQFDSWDRAIRRLRTQRDPELEGSTLAAAGPDDRLMANNDQRRARAFKIARQHLEEIRSSGVMYDTITLDGYWQQILSRPDDPDLYSTVRPEIHRAIQAGLQPYQSGRSVSARQFADLALRELSTESPTAFPTK
jgi:hypothetical protein